VNRLILFIGILILLPALGVGEMALARRVLRQNRLTARLQAIRHGSDATVDVSGQKTSSGLVWVVAVVGTGVMRSGLLSQKVLARLGRTLVAAGLRGPDYLQRFLGAKVLLFVLVPLVVLAIMQYFDLSPFMRNVALASAAMIGLLGPDRWVGRRHKKYLNAITQGLPDALDLMVICAQAGLGFEPAINRVATEIRHAHPAISEEFSQTASELRVAANTRLALMNMGARTGLESVKRMTSMLAQTLQYGTPLSDALRVLSTEMREEMLTRFETRAARLPVLLTIPMILFILPCIFLIVGGPAVIQVTQSLHK
jgi:tight adherence protein C